MKNIILLGLILSSSLAFAADKAQIKKGQKVYLKNCQSCHGEKLDGKGEEGMYLTPAPRDLVGEKYKNGDTADQIFKTLTDGMKDSAMGSFSHLSPADRKAVVAYILSVRKK